MDVTKERYGQRAHSGHLSHLARHRGSAAPGWPSAVQVPGAHKCTIFDPSPSRPHRSTASINYANRGAKSGIEPAWRPDNVGRLGDGCPRVVWGNARGCG